MLTNIYKTFHQYIGWSGDSIIRLGGMPRLKVSIELPVTSRHRPDMTERLLKMALTPNKVRHSVFFFFFFFLQVEICPMYQNEYSTRACASPFLVKGSIFLRNRHFFNPRKF